MDSITFEQMPSIVGKILEKMESIENDLAQLKDKYDMATTVPVDQDELLTIKEALVFLKVKSNTLHRWKRDGTIPFRKIGTRTYFKRSDLENYNKVEIKMPKGLRR